MCGRVVFFAQAAMVLVQYAHIPPRSLIFRSLCGVGLSRLSKEGLFYFWASGFFVSVTPFFLRIALSAALWKRCPRRKGWSVTLSAGIRTIPSLSRNAQIGRAHV